MKKLLQFIVPLIGLALLGYVLSVAIRNNGGWNDTFNVEYTALIYNLIRLAGLTTFVLISFQVITGTFMHLFNMLYDTKRFYFFHSYAGIVTLICAVTHWALVHLYMYHFNYSILEFSAMYNGPYIHFGPAALVLLGAAGVTAIVAVLILDQKAQRWWRYIHYANYLAFILVFIHSINIGSDVQSQGLKPLWYFFFAMFVVGLIYKRVIRQIQKSQQKKLETQTS
jgi:predicted ferric reductase